MKFSLNISTVLKSFPIVERFAKAKDLGFSVIESQQDIYSCPAEELKEHFTDLKCDLVNIYCDDEYPFGLASVPVQEGNFFQNLQKIMPYYNVLNFRKLHILSGETSDKFSKDDHLERLVQNLKSLVSSDFLENINVIGLIEPICADVNEKYFLNSFDTAVEIIKEVNSENVKLLLDIYHLHKITGNVKENLEKYYPYAGHVQVSQAPGRVEPLSKGEIDYTFVFDFLRKRNHQDFIGLEYFPSSTIEESLDWLKDYA